MAQDEYLAAYYIRTPESTHSWCHNKQLCRATAKLLGWATVEEVWRRKWYNGVSRCAVCKKYINRKDGLPRGAT